MSPSDFIALAEETGLIVLIGEFVLREACRQAAQWQQAGLAPIRVSVNLSGHQLRQGNLVSLVRQVLEGDGNCRRRLATWLLDGSQPPTLLLQIGRAHV